jgi:hypothetical protein
METIKEEIIYCPYCGESICIEVDVTAGLKQDFFEDCPVCCRAIEIVAVQDYDGNYDIYTKSENDF